MLIHKRRSGQPQGVAKLRSDIGFDSFILPGVGADLVTGAPVIFGTGETLTQNAYGKTLRAAANTATSGAWTIPDASAFPLATTQATVLIAGKNVTNAGNGAFGLGTVGGLDSNNLHALIPYSDGVVYFAFGGNTDGSTRLSKAGLTFSYNDVWVFTSGPRGMEIWQNGVLVASNSASPTRTNNTNAFGIRGATFDTKTDPFDCLAFGYSRRQMPKEICQSLSRDLWGTSFVQRRRGIIAGIAAAARRRVVFWG